MHGHKYGVKGGLGQAVAHAMQKDADVLIFGHTHTPLELHLRPDSERADFSVTKPLTLFNPGSLGDRHASFGTVTVRNGQLLCGHGEL
jgi:predicted phosphodiesterase